VTEKEENEGSLIPFKSKKRRADYLHTNSNGKEERGSRNIYGGPQGFNGQSSTNADPAVTSRVKRFRERGENPA